MNIRKFYLENSLGQRYDFQNKKKCILIEPTGLGMGKEFTYANIGESFIVNSKKISQKHIYGNLVFVENMYENFSEFARFLKASTEYKFVYVINNKEYLLDVDIAMIEKGEIKQDGLVCPITFNVKSLFYQKLIKRYTITSFKGESRWPLQFPIKFDDRIAIQIEVNNQGQTEASFAFEIFGYVKNPILEVYSQGILIYTLPFNITIREHEKLYFSNRDNECFVYKVLEDGTKENASDSLFIHNNNFFKLPIGISRLSFKDNINNVNLYVYQEWELV